MPELLIELQRFRSWAAAHPDARHGEWELGYECWNALWAAVLDFALATPFARWSAEEASAVIYVVARDNESQYILGEIRERLPELLPDLAAVAVREGESDAKWQVAVELGHLPAGWSPRREELLLGLARDDNEYVRRRALGSLARIGSPATEALALAAWSRPDESQEWARMMALAALHRVGSPHLERLIAEAELDGRPHLSAYAATVRSGTVDL